MTDPQPLDAKRKLPLYCGCGGLRAHEFSASCTCCRDTCDGSGFDLRKIDAMVSQLAARDAEIATLKNRLEADDAHFAGCKSTQLAIQNDALLEEIARLREALESWQKAAMAGIAHICCEECQSECDHDPGFGFDEDAYTGRAALGGNP